MIKLKTILSVLLTLVISILSLATPLITNAETQTTGLDLAVTPNKSPAVLGDTVTYTYTLINTTSSNITNLAVSDNRVTVTLPQTTLAQSENISFTGTYIIKSTDFPGPVVNTTTITGSLPNGDNITAQASASVQLTPYKTSLTIIKEADKTGASPNETITYTYTIINGSDVELKDIVVTDDKLGTIVLSSTVLGPSGNITATKTYKVTTADLPGPIVNVATVKATDPAGNPITATSNKVSVELSVNKTILTKAEVLQMSGVPGKGIGTAPGLQKLFNPNSQAALHAGKKDKDKDKKDK